MAKSTRDALLLCTYLPMDKEGMSGDAESIGTSKAKLNILLKDCKKSWQTARSKGRADKALLSAYWLEGEPDPEPRPDPVPESVREPESEQQSELTSGSKVDPKSEDNGGEAGAGPGDLEVPSLE